MITFDFGFSSFASSFCPVLSYLIVCLLLFMIFNGTVKIKINKLYNKLINNFKIVWYSAIIIIFTIITLYNHEKFNVQGLNIETVIAIVLIFLIILPFFRKIVAFGNELEIDLERKSENLNKFEKIQNDKSEKISDDTVKKDKDEMLQKFKEVKQAVSESNE